MTWSGVLVGRSSTTQGYLIYNPVTKRVLEAYHCTLHENVSGFDGNRMEFSGNV